MKNQEWIFKSNPQLTFALIKIESSGYGKWNNLIQILGKSKFIKLPYLLHPLHGRSQEKKRGGMNVCRYIFRKFILYANNQAPPENLVEFGDAGDFDFPHKVET